MVDIILDSNLKKIVGDREYTLLSGKDITEFEYSEVQPIKNKNLFFLPSVIKNIKVRRNTIRSNGYVVYLVKKNYTDMWGRIIHNSIRVVLNAICMKKLDQKLFDRFEYGTLDNFYVLYTNENKIDFSKLKLFNLDIDEVSIDV